MLIAEAIWHPPEPEQTQPEKSQPRHSSDFTHSPAFDCSDLTADLFASLRLTQLKDVSPTGGSLEVEAGHQIKASAQELPKNPDTEPAVHPQLVQEPHSAFLEKLPPELRLQLLSNLDLKSLGSLILTSRVYHEQFSMDRKSLLFKSFMNTLSGAALDAQMAFHSSTKAFLDSRSPETVDQFLRSYATYRSSSPWHLAHATSADGRASDNHRLNDTFTVDEVTSMVTFHTSVIEPLMQHFSDWTLQNLVKLPGARAFSQPLSETEKTRVSRALYRYQICCNLFGFRYWETEDLCEPTEDPTFEADYILGQLEALFEPWEVEELTCITLFFERKSEALAAVIRREFAGNDGKYDTDDSFDHDCILQRDNPFGMFEDFEKDKVRGLISRGLSVLKDIFCETKDHSQLLLILRHNAAHMMEGRFLGTYGWDVFGLDTVTGRMCRERSDRDIKEEQRAPLPFQGDHTMDPHGVYPPLAWTLLWVGTYSNQLGADIGVEIQSWGYVFWDSARMEAMDANEVLTHQCEQWHWPPSDPRSQLVGDGPELSGDDEDYPDDNAVLPKRLEET